MALGTDLCVVCGRSALGTCPLCGAVGYCSRSCQKLDWLEDHATLCGDIQRSAEDHKRRELPKEEKSLSEDVELWRLAVERLWVELRDEESLDHLSELQPLLTDAEQLSKGHGQTTWLVPRSDLQLGQQAVLVTAPHSMALLRDGQAPHLKEGNTAEIAYGIAKHLDGSCLTWSFPERRRTELLWRLSKRINDQRGSDYTRDGQLLDPRNRDPNFLATGELHQNTWFQQMTRALEHMQRQERDFLTQLNGKLETLHVDVHGCQDPPTTPSHLTIGLGAMCFHSVDHGDSEAFDDAVFFGEALLQEFYRVLTKAHVSYRLRPAGALLVRVAAPGPEDDECPRFSGAWRGTDRHTQSQQAVSFVGFSHAVQLELSKALRALLVADRTLLKNFAGALHSAWLQSRARKAKIGPAASISVPGPIEEKLEPTYMDGKGNGDEAASTKSEDEDEDYFTRFQ
eukprot:Skav200556  [mRNA]  locus=scaffold2256:71431:72795:+ [translate_table: standard]